MVFQSVDTTVRVAAEHNPRCRSSMSCMLDNRTACVTHSGVCKSDYQLGPGNCRKIDGYLIACPLVACPRERCVAMAGIGDGDNVGSDFSYASSLWSYASSLWASSGLAGSITQLQRPRRNRHHLYSRLPLETEPQHMRGRASARFILIINVAELLPGGFGALFDVGRFTARILIRARGGICITTKAAPMSSADQGGGKRRADCIASRSVAVLISGP
jgi:hypothetical protein